MSPCLTIEDVLRAGQPQVEEMRRVGDRYANAPSSPEACEAFGRQVLTCEGVMRATYGLAAKLARRSDRVEEEAQVWSIMGNFCDLVLDVLRLLRERYPDCGTPELYDLILDYKVACQARYTRAMEEMSCLTKEMPAGLFPEMT